MENSRSSLGSFPITSSYSGKYAESSLLNRVPSCDRSFRLSSLRSAKMGCSLSISCRMPLATFRWCFVGCWGRETSSAGCGSGGGFRFGAAVADRCAGGRAGADRTSERVLLDLLLLTTTDRVWGCGLGGGRISSAILDRLAFRGSSSWSLASRGRFLRPILASCGVVKGGLSGLSLLLLLLLPGRTATLCRAEDRVARPRALLLRDERREMGAIDGRGIVAHGTVCMV